MRNECLTAASSLLDPFGMRLVGSLNKRLIDTRLRVANPTTVRNAAADAFKFLWCPIVPCAIAIAAMVVYPSAAPR